MSLRFFNTLTRKKEDFVPINEREVSIYTCGPTVYNYIHIGNLRTFLFEDILVRYLKYKGYEVHQIMNLTDVDDKTIRNSIQQNVSLNDYTQKFKEAFFKDIQTLNITPAEKYPCATDHIDEMITLIHQLEENGMAYRSEGSIYFSINKFNEYGKLAHLDRDNLKAGASGRVSNDEYEKENIGDFVLWKAYTPEDGDVYWDTSLGKGRPGWHIECSAMSMKYLGETFDIHTGGVDNIFPHHENEIAQSEGVTEKPFVHYWLHSEFLNISGEKSSKSKGNVIYLQDLLDKGFSKEVIRFSLIQSHYRSKVNYSEDILGQAKSTLEGIHH
ncbi:MAG TPA: cysteine--tRNA ligase, partial [Spirochaetes bacterium]|nr:cysteine--tRNA ligase [Spirochaetota bacterium]